MARARTNPLFTEAVDSHARSHLRRCEAEGCAEAGEFRAPRSRDQLNEYRWFCLDHVRAYNKQWDFYAGMAADEIEAHIRRDTTWQRPTWPLGGGASTRLRDDIRVHDPLGVFSGGLGGEEDRTEGFRRRRPATPEEKAAAVLDLTLPVSLAEVKKQYKQLVKRHHPDANGGDKDAEERLKSINEAYATLRSSLAYA
jgi:DnaJ-domain-containing protein 1